MDPDHRTPPTAANCGDTTRPAGDWPSSTGRRWLLTLAVPPVAATSQAPTAVECES